MGNRGGEVSRYHADDKPMERCLVNRRCTILVLENDLGKDCCTSKISGLFHVS